jgi:hypothetical protein
VARRAYFKLVSCLAYFSTLTLEAMCSYETSIDYTALYPEGRTLHNARTSNPTSRQKLERKQLPFVPSSIFNIHVSNIMSLCFLYSTKCGDRTAKNKESKYFKPNQGGWDGQSMEHAWQKSAFKILVGKPERKRPLWRPRHRWEDNGSINTDLK